MTTKNLVALPYAQALFDLAKDKGLLTEIASDVSLIGTYISNTPNLQKFFTNPTVTVSDKTKVLEEVFSEYIGKITLQFLTFVANKGRLGVLEEIVTKFSELSFEYTSVTFVDVTSAIQLSVEQQSALVDKLKEITDSKQIKLKLNVDSTLLGGFIVKMGSQLIDNSLKTQMQKFAFHLGASVSL
jgi:F-type H+-transporting ATPase subunit delta